MMHKEPIYKGKSKIKGRGVFASRDINKGEKIFDFKGQRINSLQLGVVAADGRDMIVDPLQISQSEYLSLKEPYVLVNHSCDPNSGIVGKSLIAIKTIRGGQEITFDYSTTWFDGFLCNCGSKNCRHHIGDFTNIPKNIQRKYLALGIIPDFIKKSLKI